MKEHGIIFQGWSVRAILEGRKTQTRRVVKPQPDRGFNRLTWWQNPDDSSQWFEVDEDTRTRGPFVRCPYGLPGDRLWVRETFALSIHDPETMEPDTRNPNDWDRPVYKADGEEGAWRRESVVDGKLISEPLTAPPWRSPIHMPRWASRITLHLVGVRVERVQDISEEDARAEGIKEPAPVHGRWCDPTKGRQGHWSYRKPFAEAWDAINAKRGFGWAANPWVWVLQWDPVAS